MKDFYSFVLNDDLEKYSDLLKQMDDYTAYHTPQYLLAEEKAEEVPLTIFVYDDGEQLALLPSIKRNIGAIRGLERYGNYYDLKTPHEYSGVLTSDNSEQLCLKFFNALENYCQEHKIIFQFIRFNPYRQTDSRAAEKCGYNVTLSNQQTYVKLEHPLEKIFENFSPSARRNIRTALRNDLVCECVDASKENVDVFQRLYVSAMKRLDAKPFFYFNREYFYKLLIDNDVTKLVFVKHGKNVAAAAILLLSQEHSYYHLGCFDMAFSKLRPMDYLFYGLVKISKLYDKKFLHLGGGGLTLKRFKQKFSDALVDYYVAHKIFDGTIYKKICEEYLNATGGDVDKNFLPLYRSQKSNIL